MKKLTLAFCLIYLLIASGCVIVVRDEIDPQSSEYQTEATKTEQPSTEFEEQKTSLETTLNEHTTEFTFETELVEELTESATESETLGVTYDELLAELDAEYNRALKEIQDRYLSLADEIDMAIDQWEQQISTLQAEYADLSSEVNASIRILERQRDNEYAAACAQTGGMPNSYANSIKASYDKDIQSLRSSLEEARISYDAAINECDTKINECLGLYEQLIPAAEREIDDLDTWYNEQLLELNEQFGRTD